MLLPSALSCDGSRAIPSSSASTSMLLSPVPRHQTRSINIPQVALFAPTPSVGRDDTSSTLRSSAVEGIFMTCKKLHQILSLEPPRSASPAPNQLTVTHNAFNNAIASPLPPADAPPRNHVSQITNNAQNRLAVPSSLISQAPQTPQPRQKMMRVPKTPMRRNKRRRADDSDEDDGFYRIPVQSPKRPRLSVSASTSTSTSTTTHSSTATTSTATKFNRRCRQLRINASSRSHPATSSSTLPLPASSNSLQLHNSSPPQQMDLGVTSSSTDTTITRDWSNAEDRLLVEMVLQKMRLSPRDWADCARSLGRDPRTVGNRWEMIVESLMGGSAGGVGKRRRLEER